MFASQITRPEAILFDHDGVLINSEPLHISAWLKLLKEKNLPGSAEEIEALAGKAAPEIISKLLDRYRPGWRRAEYDPDALALRKNEHYLAGLDEGMEVFSGVREGLKWLRSAGVKTAVVSNAKRRELVRAHEVLGLKDHFDALVSRDDAGSAKPDPGPYLFAAGVLGVEPRNCLAVEDSPTGLESALIAKIPAAAILTSFPRSALEHPVPGRPDLAPIWIGKDPTEFFEWLKTLPAR